MARDNHESSSQLIRWGGLAAIVAGLAWIGGFVLSGLPAAATLAEHLSYLSFVTPLLFAAFALIGLHARLGGSSLRLVRAGFILAYLAGVIALVTIVALLLFGLRVLPQPAGAGTFIAFFGVLGSAITLGIAGLRTNALPRWGSLLPLAIGVLTIPSLLMLRSVWGLMVGLAWLALGYAILHGRHRDPQQVHTA